MLVGKDLSYEIGNQDVFKNVSIAISKGDKIGLVGPNGAGKTTLLRLLSGEIYGETGVISTGEMEVSFLPQDMSPYHLQPVGEFIADATGVTDVKLAYEHAEEEYVSDPENHDALERLTAAAVRLGFYEVDSFESTLVRSLTGAGLDESVIEKEIGDLSGGQRTRVALAAIMASKHDVVLLDEPTNNLDLEGIRILEDYIKASSAAFLMVSHDRRFLRNATNRIVELLGGDKGVNNYGLGYEEYVEARVKAYIAERRRYEEHSLSVKSLESSLRNARVRANSAEGSRSKKDNDKLGANHRRGRASTHLAQSAQSLESRLDRLKSDAPRLPQEPVSLAFEFSETGYTSQTLLKVEDLTVTYTDSEQQFGPYNLLLKSRDRVAVVGSNGTGKSTLLRAITSNVKGDQTGETVLGAGARVAYIDQDQTLPRPDATPLDNLLALAPGTAVNDAMNLLVKFNLNRDTLTTMKAANLSGGERAKILLAAIVASKANLLILDEPTNNLDIPTIDALQEALATYKGAILLASHDREFMDGVGITKTIHL